MKILITAGGTTEKIDEVRKITNVATGRLGSLTAQEFINRANAQITYVCDFNADIPAGSTVNIIRLHSVEELKNIVEDLMTKERFDAVIHTMAVSDYTVRKTVSAEDLSLTIAKILYENRESASQYDKLVETVRDVILHNAEADCRENPANEKKISSEINNLIVIMDQTPKIIRLIKQIQPETILVGFKLLVDVSQETLLDTGHDMLVKNNCDFVLANDLNNINQDKHEGILIKPDYSYVRLNTKNEIARAITDSVLKKVIV